MNLKDLNGTNQTVKSGTIWTGLDGTVWPFLVAQIKP